MGESVKMETVIPHSDLAACRPTARAGWRRLKLWVAHLRRNPRARRARRVVLLLAMLTVINVFDLIFTLIATRSDSFRELNPIAAALVESDTALVAFKAFMVLLAFGIFIRFRRHLLTEIACWGLSAVYALLAGRWWVYYFLYSA